MLMLIIYCWHYHLNCEYQRDDIGEPHSLALHFSFTRPCWRTEFALFARHLTKTSVRCERQFNLNRTIAQWSGSVDIYMPRETTKYNPILFDGYLIGATRGGRGVSMLFAKMLLAPNRKRVLKKKTSFEKRDSLWGVGKRLIHLWRKFFIFF